MPNNKASPPKQWVSKFPPVEKIYGRDNRIAVLDRSMVSEKNVDYLRKGARRYIVGIVGTPKSQLRLPSTMGISQM